MELKTATLNNKQQLKQVTYKGNLDGSLTNVT